MKLILRNLPMPIRTDRLLIKPPEIGEGKALNAVLIDSFEIIRHTMPWAKTLPTIDESEQFVREAAANWILKKNDEPYFPLFIFDIQTNDLIGAAGFHHVDWEVPSLEIGYWISKHHAGKGYMTEAINAHLHYAFLELKMRRVAITCDVNNIRSKKIPERLGFTLEATLKNHRIYPSTNQISDTLLYAKYDLMNCPKLNVKWG